MALFMQAGKQTDRASVIERVTVVRDNLLRNWPPGSMKCKLLALVIAANSSLPARSLCETESLASLPDSLH